MSKKLLLADDSITIQKVIGITFSSDEYDLSVVDNGDAALEKAQAERPDLILADVFMPGKNGYELCSAVKQDPQLKDVPVLLLTGTFEPFDKDKALSCGADSWIAKPFESQTLVELVEKLISGAGQSEAEGSAMEPELPSFASSEPAKPEAEEEEILTLDEGDILEDLEILEEDEDGEGFVLGQAQEESPATPSGEVDFDPFQDTDQEVDFSSLSEEPAAAASVEAPAEETEFSGFEDEFAFSLEDGSEEASDEEEIEEEFAVEGLQGEEESPWIAPELPQQEPQTAPPVAAEEAPAPEPVARFERIEPVQQAEQTEPAQTVEQVQPTEQIETQVAALSEEELTRIVEKVAGSVIERLAGTLLEKIAWEVVPDLSERLIKEEIRKIREGAQ